MPIKLNHDGYAHALELVKAGKVDKSPEWSIGSEEKDAMAGGKDNPDWPKYGMMCLAENSAEPANTQAHWEYPYGKDGKVWRRALTAIRQRASAQGATDVYDAAGKLLDELDQDVNEEVMAAESMTLVAAEDSGPDSKGYIWDIRIVKYGLTTNGKDFYNPEALKAAVPVYEGMRVFALEEGQHQAAPKPFGKSPREIVGWVDGVHAGADGLYGKFHIIRSAKWLRDGVLDAWEQGKKDLFAFSNDIGGVVSRRTVDGKQVRYLEKVVSAQLDVVYEPIGGGEFLRMVAAKESGGKEHKVMNREQLLAALKRWRPEEHGKVTARINAGEDVKDEELATLLAAAPGPDPEPDKDGDETKKRLDAMEKRTCDAMLRAALAESDLPEPTKEKIRAAFKDRVYAEETLTAALREEREYLGKVAGGASPEPFAGRVEVTGQPERLQAALDMTVGLEVTGDKFKDITAFEGIRAAYARITGDINVTGDPRNFSKEYLRMCAAGDGGSGISTGTFPVLLGNTLYRRLLAEYRRVDYGLGRIISFTRRATDYKSMQSVNIGYFNDIPAVNPEVSDYTEINSSAIGEDAISFSIANKGIILTITRATILNDDMGAVQKLITRLGRAFIRTRARNAWNLLINNSTYQPDGLAVFHANHGNLGSSALGGATSANKAAAIVAAISGIMNQTEPASGETIGLELAGMKLCLVVPTASGMWDGAASINQAQYLDNTFLPNPVYHKFGLNDENILVLPLLADANDWYVIGDPAEREIIESAYLNGQEEPQMFVADIPTVGQMFVGDKIQYKGRHEYNDVVVDYRNVYKHVVA